MIYVSQALNLLYNITVEFNVFLTVVFTGNIFIEKKHIVQIYFNYKTERKGRV